LLGHFTRNFLSAQELAKTASAQRFCREALALQRQLFRLWYRFRGAILELWKHRSSFPFGRRPFGNLDLWFQTLLSLDR